MSVNAFLTLHCIGLRPGNPYRRCYGDRQEPIDAVRKEGKPQSSKVNITLLSSKKCSSHLVHLHLCSRA